MSKSDFDAFAEKFQLSELEVFKTAYWICSLRPVQPTLGSLVLSLRRPCGTLGGLRAEEGADFASACNLLEEHLEAAFAPDKLNYLALMMVDHQLHFHVIPRYAESRTFLGVEWSDIEWPTPPDVTRGHPVEDVRSELLLALKIAPADRVE